MNATVSPPRPTIAALPPRARGTDPAHDDTRRREPAWARPALIALLLCTAVAYLWDLSASGYANSFYAAAVQAGTHSWKSFFFGSIDSSNFITVDKPPASLWVMELSGRIFGFSSWSMLAPQALEGVLAVGLLHATVKRWFGSGAGLLAGALFAITPVAALMFRFNNPDALLVCLLVAAAYCLTRAIEHAGTRWVLAAGAMVGFAFLAKMMQAFLVLPAFAGVYLLVAPTTLRRRFTQLLAGAGAMILAGGWWVAIVALWPAGSRPMIDGSSDNSILNLITGYNGLGRIFGASGPGGGGGGANFSGSTGVLRLFNELMGGQASWMLPAALLALVVCLWRVRSRPRTDRTRAALLLWGGWLIVSGVVFSFGSGVIHTYYTVALAPAIAALVAIGVAQLWRERDELWARLWMALGVLSSAAWCWVLLDRTPQWESWLRLVIPAAAVLAAACVLAAPSLRRLGARAGALTAVFAVVACLSGPIAYSAQTISTAHTGSIPSAGPATSMGAGGFGMRGGTRPSGAGGAPGGSGQGGFPGASGSSGTPPTGAGANTGSGPSLFGGGTSSGSTRATGAPGGTSGAGATNGGGGMGGQLSVSTALKQALESGAGNYRWVAAVSGSQSAASLELATGGEPVMGIGGFSNEGGNLSLAQFKVYVAKGEIHYYIASGNGAGGGPGGRSSSGSSITAWVKANYKSVTVGSQTLYDLTQPLSS